MRLLTLLLSLGLSTGGLQADPFDDFRACIGPELADRSRFNALYTCGQQDQCNAANLTEELSFQEATRIACGADQIERCVVGAGTERCLRDFAEMLLEIRRDIAGELEVNRLDAVAQTLNPLTRRIFLRRSEGFGPEPDSQIWEMECPRQDLMVEEGMGIHDNLFCHASRALSVWLTAETLRAQVERAEANAE